MQKRLFSYRKKNTWYENVNARYVLIQTTFRLYYICLYQYQLKIHLMAIRIFFMTSPNTVIRLFAPDSTTVYGPYHSTWVATRAFFSFSPNNFFFYARGQTNRYGEKSCCLIGEKSNDVYSTHPSLLVLWSNAVMIISSLMVKVLIWMTDNYVNIVNLIFSSTFVFGTHKYWLYEFIIINITWRKSRSHFYGSISHWIAWCKNAIFEDGWNITRCYTSTMAYSTENMH